MHETKAIENKIAIAQLYKSGATGLDITSLIVRLQVGGILASQAFHPTLTEAV